MGVSGRRDEIGRPDAAERYLSPRVPSRVHVLSRRFDRQGCPPARFPSALFVCRKVFRASCCYRLEASRCRLDIARPASGGRLVALEADSLSCGGSRWIIRDCISDLTSARLRVLSTLALLFPQSATSDRRRCRKAQVAEHGHRPCVGQIE
jgi:hypothetical protein